MLIVNGIGGNILAWREEWRTKERFGINGSFSGRKAGISVMPQISS